MKGFCGGVRRLVIVSLLLLDDVMGGAVLSGGEWDPDVVRRFKLGADKEDVAASDNGGNSRSLECDDGTAAANGV